MHTRDMIAVGTSAGGIGALRKLFSCLPLELPASIVIVQHLSPESPGYLPDILNEAGRLPVSFAKDGDRPQHGRVYVAPPDRHLICDSQCILRLAKGPRENFARPAIDPTFRSLALAYGNRVVGIILSGRLDDGAQGLKAVELAGGLTIAQDPVEAEYRDMPANALQAVPHALKAGIEEICQIVLLKAGEPLNVRTPSQYQTMREIEIEAAIAAGDANALAGVSKLGKPVPISCPECGGMLFEIDSYLRRYRCHTGHAFSPASLLAGAREQSEFAMWSAIRVLQEEAILIARMAEFAQDARDDRLEQRLRDEANRTKMLADRIRELEQTPGDRT